MFDYDLLCIGSGPAGQRAAVQAAKLGKRTAVIERGRFVGGVCVDTGTIPSKTFREAVLTVMGRAGFTDGSGQQALWQRPSAQALMARVAEVEHLQAEIIREQLQRNDVTVLSGEAAFQDAHTVVVSRESRSNAVTAANILLAVGTVPAPPPSISPKPDLVVTSDELLQITSLPRRLAVIGAGVIGIEYASMFAALGIEVTVVDKRERPLEFLDGELVDELLHQMRNAGVTFRLGEAVERLEIVEGLSKRILIFLESGKRLVSDLVLFSAGRQGATDRLNLPAAGLKADDRGRLTVDQAYRTSVPHIFAAGDVIGFPSLATTSAEQGRLAACAAFGIDAEPMAPHFPIGIYAIPELSAVGEPEHVLTARRVPYESGVARYREIARGHILGDDSGFLKLLFHRQDHRLLGVHAVGTGATELIHIGQAVLGLGGGLDYFLSTAFNYPTLTECYKVAALDAFNKLA
ncbi:MAG: Si-specific NAD(P)(+) transhydrogenase [Nitrospira sp.]|nr:Si-specific NAD(P)(+) transhydrogenase [Nitrospira sp.]MDH4244795.1 Si-specific NAD(P)(+) transhydrogenase [Nitrospira sp.]MDH4356094.1 Si-specific NAD(P)(+) transhydrogenase [Nitrospira sp.]MDH5318222.1 Si-specific NAD(P)(+) transhydrogenase [Nitrospira sp.]